MFYVWLAFAGVAGTLARYGLGIVRPSIYTTFAINVVGSFAFVLVWCLAEENGLLSDSARIALLVGFLGAFTTFSTFAFDTRSLLASGRLLEALGYVLGQNVLGVLGCMLGIVLARTLT